MSARENRRGRQKVRVGVAQNQGGDPGKRGGADPKPLEWISLCTRGSLPLVSCFAWTWQDRLAQEAPRAGTGVWGSTGGTGDGGR